MAEGLFDSFEPVSARQWKQKIQFDLKGADYNTTLLTHTDEGITIKPFYHEDTVAKRLKTDGFPEAFRVAQSIFVHHPKKAGLLAADALARGADAIAFTLNDKADIRTLTAPLKHQAKTLFFNLNFLDRDFLDHLQENTSGFDTYLNIDLIGNLARIGNWFYNRKKDNEILNSLIQNTKTNKIFSIDVSLYQNAGANNIQQVAYALAQGNEYLNHLEQLIERQVISRQKAQQITAGFTFIFSTGPHFFFEIAKLRSFRHLWTELLQQYGYNGNALIFVEPGLRNKTLFDPNVNMLRTTSEMYSAILGGADILSNLAYDSVYHRKNEFGERIARNQLLILKEESHIRNAQAGNGAYYIDALSVEMAEKALQIFQAIEKKSGFVKMLENGTIQRKIKESAQKEQDAFNRGELVLIGTNKFPNKDEKIRQSDLELYPFMRKRRGKTIIEPVIPVRLAEKSEQERLKSGLK